MLSSARRAVSGGLAAILDSGGERELLVDIAAEAGVPFARIGADTTRVLQENLDPGLEAINPLDAWGTGRDFEQLFETCFAALINFSSVACPCTSALAASHNECTAAATVRAADINPSDHW